MARPVKPYNHAVAPNPRRVRIFAAEKGIELLSALPGSSNRKQRRACRSGPSPRAKICVALLRGVHTQRPIFSAVVARPCTAIASKPSLARARAPRAKIFFLGWCIAPAP